MSGSTVKPAAAAAPPESPGAAACRSMDEVRAAIDRIDRQIVALLAERGAYVRQAARVKARRSDIIDHARIEEVVAKVRRAAEAEGVDPGLVEAVYRLMIDRFIALEAAQFDRLQEGAADISS